MKSLHKLLSFFILLAIVVPVQAALPEFKDLVKKASPAVVNISTTQVQSQRQSNFPEFEGPNGEQIPEIFRHFFRLPPGNEGSQPRRQAPQSLGSGFIISDDGYILTNHHVIKDADEVIVRLNDRRQLDAVVVGSDERSDVALLKIDASDLPTVPMGNSDKAEVGEWVLAIGSPFGFDYSVTAGIISATDRSLSNGTYVPFIQTDVAINPGNSGGPLFNLEGEVIGINSQIYTRSGGFMGLSFAIPMNVAMDVVEQLKSSGEVQRGWLGVVIQEVSRDLAESFGLDKPEGALVAKVLPGSPAEAAGLMEGDVIFSFDGMAINRSSDLPHHVGRVKPNSDAVVSVIRNGSRKSIDVTIGVLDEGAMVMNTGQSKSNKPAVNRLNIQIGELDQQVKDRWSVTSGVIVRRVDAGAGADAGLLPGDVITILNGQRIESVRKFDGIVADLPTGRAVPMRIVRRGSPMFIPLKLN